MTFNDSVAARTIWQEARGEGELGMKTVAHVIRNRVADGRWGKTPASVCLWPLQFSGWRPSDPNFAPSCALAEDDATLAECAAAWEASASENDPTDGACFYFADSMAPYPTWSRVMVETAHIGHHIFMRDK